MPPPDPGSIGASGGPAGHVSRIREVQPWVGGDYLAILHDGRKLKVSRTYRDELLRPLS